MSTPVLPNLLHPEGEATWIPEGFLLVKGPDGQKYVVPEVFALTLLQSLDAYQKGKDLNIEKAAASVCFFFTDRDVAGMVCFHQRGNIRQHFFR